MGLQAAFTPLVFREQNPVGALNSFSPTSFIYFFFFHSLILESLLCGSQRQPPPSVMPCPPCNRAATGASMGIKTVPWRGNFFCTLSLVIHLLGTRKGKVLVQLSEFLRMIMGNHHCCLYSVFTIKLYFSTVKVGMDRRKFFELGLNHLLEDRTSGSHFLLGFHTSIYSKALGIWIDNFPLKWRSVE